VREEAKEVKEVEEVEEKNGGVAAFFDLDGTLTSLPSLEKRFFLMLRYRKLIGIRNYFMWLAEALRLIPRGINQVMHANKMYLRGVRVGAGVGVAGIPVLFFAEAIERVAWHAARGHLVVIVSGTLEFLALRAARVLEVELGARGLVCTIRVCATRLEDEKERWTGRIAGDAMFGEAKARAVRRIAAEENLDLRRCFAYGDSTSDSWMLECVGKPAAVNPSNDLARIARRNDWAVLLWGKEKTFTPRTQSAQRTKRLKSGRTDEIGDGLQMSVKKAGFRA
jgi:HAD superfamily hydrolase (TIGR01490 family)